jgi:hypothetical protein
MWSVHLLPNTSYGDRKRLMREYRQNTAHLSCWHDDGTILRTGASTTPGSNTGGHHQGGRTPSQHYHDAPPPHARRPAEQPALLLKPTTTATRHDGVDAQQLGWGNRVLGTADPEAFLPPADGCGPRVLPHPAVQPTTTTSPPEMDEFGEFSYCSADFHIYTSPVELARPSPPAPPQYSHPSLMAPGPFNSSRSPPPQPSLSSCSPSSSSTSSPTHPSLLSSSSSSSSNFPVSLPPDEALSHFTSPEREIFHVRYATYQTTEENARVFLHTMIILSVLDAKASRKAEGDPKRAKIFKRMAEKAESFERVLRSHRTSQRIGHLDDTHARDTRHTQCKTTHHLLRRGSLKLTVGTALGSMPVSYHQSTMLIMISARADCNWRMHDEIFTLVALQDFLSTCRSIDMRYVCPGWYIRFVLAEVWPDSPPSPFSTPDFVPVLPCPASTRSLASCSSSSNHSTPLPPPLQSGCLPSGGCG